MKSAAQRLSVLVTLIIACTALFFIRQGAWGLVLWVSLLIAVPVVLLFRSTDWRKALAAFKNLKGGAIASPVQTKSPEVKP